MLKTVGLSFTVDGKEILRNITLNVPAGSFVGVVGPNGSGKSTLLKTVYRSHKPSSGAVYLNGQAMDKLSGREAAKQLAALPQENELSFEFTVMEVMLIGRFAHRGLLGRTAAGDLERCREALGQVGMLEFKDRNFLSLSGGEKQRVLIAGAFARETPLIVLDEPTNHLDIGYQFLLMDLMKSKRNTTVFASVHDLNLALRYCDSLVVLSEGQVAAVGEPRQVLTPALMEEVFKVKAALEQDAGGLWYIRYIGAA